MIVRDRIPLRRGLSETILAYAAGVMDCDGTISVGRTRGYPALMLVTNGNLRFLEWLHSAVGGVIESHSLGAQHLLLSTAPMYRWRLRQGEIAEFCSAILPYLVGKRPQAELLIESMRLKREWPGCRPALIRHRLLEIADECSWCNRRAWRGGESPHTETTEIPEQAKLELVS